MIIKLEFKFFAGKYLPPMRFLYRKSLFKNVFDQNIFISSTARSA